MRRSLVFVVALAVGVGLQPAVAHAQPPRDRRCSSPRTRSSTSTTAVFALHAISAADGHLLWDAPNPLPSYAAASYANGVVFPSDTFGFSIRAYDADTGTQPCALPLGAAPSSAPATVGDSVYVGSGTETPQMNAMWAIQLAGSS